MPDSIEIEPVAGPVSGSIRPPGSKSITNRALPCAALASGTSTLQGVLHSDDTKVMIESLQRLGIRVTAGHDANELVVHGCGGSIPAQEAELFIGNSGTTVRFLTALVAVGNGTFQLDGVPRMRERPIQDLLDALQELGVDAKSDRNTGCPPVTINATGLNGGCVNIRGDISSQYLSGLMMAAPYARIPTDIQIVGELVSRPYIEMTCAVMKSFGVEVSVGSENMHVPTGNYAATMYEIEPDASAASYFWAIAAITGGRVRVDGLHRHALQGDVGFCDCLRQMGCSVHYGSNFIEVEGAALHGIDVNMNSISDTVQTLAAVALFAKGPTRVRGVAHNRHKETDRIGDLATELRKFGARVDEFEDGLEITPGELRGATIETYDDHRMAMSLALPGLRVPRVVINDPGCTAKTYPEFFHDLSVFTSRSS